MADEEGRTVGVEGWLLHSPVLFVPIPSAICQFFKKIIFLSKNKVKSPLLFQKTFFHKI